MFASPLSVGQTVVATLQLEVAAAPGVYAVTFADGMVIRTSIEDADMAASPSFVITVAAA